MCWKIVSESIKRKLLIFLYLNKSYSQEGEDLLLNRIFDKSNGFFIDIGAHHPKKYSNTYKLYLKGWTGINIDIEGLDLAVLKSNDWTKYRPDYILVEELRMDINSIINTSETYKYLTTKGYTFYARTFNTSFYKKNVEV